MRNVLLVGEAYGGGVKTYIDTITLNQEKESDVCFQVLVSSKRLEKNEGINSDYLIENNMSFGKSPLKMIKALWTLHRLIKDRKIDVVHANSTFAGVLMYIYSSLNHRPFYIYSPHGYYSFKSMGKAKKKAVRFIEKQINKSSDLIIHVSPSEEREAIENKLTTSQKSVVILNGSKDPGIISPRKAKDSFTIINLARVDDPKNPFEFIEIARNIIHQNKNVRFIWAGNGKYLEKAREKVKSYGLEGKVDFVGFLSAKEKVFMQSDLYLSTSEYEGLPFAVVEAMSYGLPLLLTDIVGHTDLVFEKENGLLFKNKEDAAIYEFVENLIQNPDQWNTLSNNSYRIFSERFNITQMLKKLTNIYQNV